MPRTTAKYALHVGLYSLFWIVLSLLGYQILHLHQPVPLPPGPYYFLAGLFWLVCAALRSVRPTDRIHHHRHRDPFTHSFALSGLLLIVVANVA